MESCRAAWLEEVLPEMLSCRVAWFEEAVPCREACWEERWDCMPEAVV